MNSQQPSVRTPDRDLSRPPAPSPRTAGAWQLRRGAGIEGLALGRQHLPAVPGDDQVLVRIRAASLNYRDLLVARGNGAPAGPAFVPGSDGAGEVIAVGPAVTDLEVGDRVVGSFFPDWILGAPSPAAVGRALGGGDEGMLATSVMLPRGAWVRAPAHMDAAEAATLPCAGLVAWNALFEAEPSRPGQTVLLLGTGGVSSWALALAKAAGQRVIVTSSDDGKLARATACGADETINYRRHPEWQDEVLRLTGGVGVDRVLEVGGVDTLARSLAALRMGGTAAIIGRLSGTELPTLDPAAVYGGAKRLVGVLVGSAAMLDALARFTELHRIRPQIDRRFGFEAAADAYRYLESGNAFGKVVVEMPATAD